MTTQGRFTVLTDENQAPKATIHAGRKRVLGVLTEVQQKLASNIPKQLGGKQSAKNKENAQILVEKNVNNKDIAQQKFQPATVKPKVVEKIEEPIVEIFRKEETLASPLDSPMIISPAPNNASPVTDVAETTKENRLNDDFFTTLYGNTHYKYLRDMELKLKPRHDYMSKQRDISSEMRTVLIDWLVEVNEEYRMSDETLFLGVSLIDRFLSLMSVVRGKLQLVGTAAIFVASKVEDIYPPQIAELVYITDDTYTTAQIIRMEALLLKNLNFSICSVHPLTFLRNLSIQGDLSAEAAHMAQYIAELSLLTLNMMTFRASEVAAASIVEALHQVHGNTDKWTSELHSFSQVDRLQLGAAVEFLHSLLVNANSSPHKAIPNKYADRRYSSVSLLPIRETLPQLNIK